MKNDSINQIEEKNKKQENVLLPKSFLDLLVTEKPLKYKFKKIKPKKVKLETLTYELDDQLKFRNMTAYIKPSSSSLQTLSSSYKNLGYKKYLKRKQVQQEIEKQYAKAVDKMPIDQEYTYPFDIVEWEKNIIYDTENLENSEEYNPVINEFIDTILDEKWEQNIVFDETIQTKHKNYPTLFLEDPNIIFDKIDDKKSSKNKKKQREYFSGDKPIKSKYNISNDKYYISDSKPKSSLGSFGVQHSLPALKLDPKFYKTNHTKEELRDFHRPPLQLPKNCRFTFKKITKKEKTSSSIIKKVSELTLKDGSDFELFEFSEEMPPFIVNCGMVSLINTYYRKTSTRDEYESDQPNFTILDPDDKSPFFSFGDIKPGTSLKALTNNLFTAPIFEHNNNDILCIVDKSNPDEDVIYYRNIKSIYCVGQEFPLEEIYAPHSRKLNNFCKNRLKAAAYRLFAFKEKGSREFKMSQLDALFPYFSEGSKRKWLKEYAECIKKGKENVWILKPCSTVLNEEDIRRLITPENICQYESMLASERKLEDCGYKCVLDSQEEEDESVYIIPWQLTRNFVNACNGKGLLELVGPAEPTCLGEGFSFRKIKLIKGNEAENRKIISEHQARYKTEIERIWNKQLNALSSDKDIPFDPAFIQEEVKEEKTVENLPIDNKDSLEIRRTYTDGESERVEVERITDPKIIKLYMKLRKTVKFEDKKPGLKCGNCGLVGHMKTNKACPNFIHSKKPTKKIIDHERRKAKSIFQEIMLSLLNTFFNIPFSLAFHRPVSVKKFPDYLKIVENPIDLTTIKTKVRHNKYKKFQEFLDDLHLMRDNCVKYNGPEHSLTKIAQSMVDIALEKARGEQEQIAEAEMIFSSFNEPESNT